MSDVNGQYAQALASLVNQLNQQGQGGNVDLTNRPRVSAQDIANAGYDIGNNYATTYTGTYSNPSGDIAANFTPIQVNNGELQKILTDAELQNYAESVINGTRNDDLGLQIGGMYNGADAIQNADRDAQLQHNLQEQYYALLNAYKNR